MIRGTPMRSSAASWVPSSVWHSSPTCVANSSTRLDLPMPGCPQMKTGLTTATCRSISGNCAGVTVTDACIPRQGTAWAIRESLEYNGLAAVSPNGDRTGDLSALATRHWDAVVDVPAYDPEVVRRSTRALADAADRYVFVSTVSVYADHGVWQIEGTRSSR